MADRPFMQLYGSDFVGDTLHLSTEQIGAYLLLLIAMWNNGGSLPDDERKLSRIARLSLHKWRHSWPDLAEFFEVGDGVIFNNRVKKELEKLQSFSQKARQNGARGGAAKALKNKKAGVAKATNSLPEKPSIARATPEPEPESSSLRSESSSPPLTEKWWERFWELYPHKVGKADARKSFERATKRVDESTMLEALGAYVGKTDDRPWCNPSTWLNQDRWADRPASAPQQQQRIAKPKARDMGDVIDELAERINGNGNGQRSDAGDQAPKQLVPPADLWDR